MATGRELMKQQLEQFETIKRESEEMGVTRATFFNTMHQALKERYDAGDDTPLSEVQMAGVLQQKKKIAARKNSDVKSGTYGTLTVTEEPEEEVVVQAISYAQAIMNDGKLIFEKGSGLGWVNGEATGMDEGQQYSVEIKELEGVKKVTSARIAAPIDVTEFEVSGDESDIYLPVMFSDHAEGISFPIVDPTFYTPQEIEDFFDVIFNAAKKSPQNIMISGPQGTGKTSVIQQQAARHNLGFFQMSCGMIESPAEWFGFRDVQGSELVYVVSAFIKACETPNTVILLDEFNRLHTSLQNGLYNILDNNGQAWIDFVKRYVRVAAGVVFVATANIGAAHTGTFQLDAAMEDRFAYHLKMGYLPESDELRVLMMKTGISRTIGHKLVKVANNIRKCAADEDHIIGKPISFRQLHSVATLIAAGMKPRRATELTILPKFSDDGGEASEQAEVLKILQGQFGS